MKFLCDRCKTRYSIGDDRVRGKILKIRCKNCANVITVREGMTEPEPSEARRHRPTTAAPLAASTQTAQTGGNGALGAAFSAQIAKPPPALEEEWYVSIDGDQSGPFSLADAQRWVAARAWDAELYCWSEGFDDWLPVDKVSHFRGLRKRPPAPPPMPRAPARLEEEPKPLFAATMASLERSSGAVTLPPVAAAPAAVPKVVSAPVGAMSPQPMVAKTNGASAIPVATKAKASSQVPAIPRISPSGPVSSPVPKVGSQPHRSSTAHGVGKVSAGAKAIAQAFDVDPADSLTAVEAPQFKDEVETTAEPIAAKHKDRLDLAIEAARNDVSGVTQPVDLADVEDNLDIGEVSRVVKLADLAKMSAPRPKPVRPALALRATGSIPKMDPAVLASGTHDAVVNAEAAPGESMVVSAPIVSQRRGMMMLLGVAALLLLGVIGAVVMIVATGDNEDLPLGLGHTSQIDTSRPEDVRRTGPGEQPPGPGSAAPNRPVRHLPFVNPNLHVGPNPIDETPTDPTKAPIKADEVQDMAQKRTDGTTRCYMRAQKGALGFDIQNVKKIMVTMSIDKEGLVTDVELSEHGADTFGKCLIGQMKSWKFRTSPGGGTFKFALAFSNG